MHSTSDHMDQLEATRDVTTRHLVSLPTRIIQHVISIWPQKMDQSKKSNKLQS